jgi:hypothetical protein
LACTAAFIPFERGGQDQAARFLLPLLAPWRECVKERESSVYAVPQNKPPFGRFGSNFDLVASSGH